MVGPELVVWSTFDQWVRDGERFGFMATEVASSLLAKSADGRRRLIVEVGTRVVEE